jgi:periplasmic protein TonB
MIRVSAAQQVETLWPRRPSRAPAAAESPDVLARALKFGRRSRVRGFGLGLGGTVLAHGALVAFVVKIVGSAPVTHKVAPTTIDIQTAPAPPPKPAPPPPPPPKAAPEPAPSVPRAAAPAQAAKVLTQAPDPNQPVDMSNDGFINGNADSYAGGLSSANGTSKSAVAAIAQRPAPPAARRVPPPPPEPDLSRPALPAGARNWNCGFPPEADAEQINHAVVTLFVKVGPNGVPLGAVVMSDPGNGFGRAARQCAMEKTYQAALNRSGQPITAKTPPFIVNFNR